MSALSSATAARAAPFRRGPPPPTQPKHVAETLHSAWYGINNVRLSVKKLPPSRMSRVLQFASEELAHGLPGFKLCEPKAEKLLSDLQTAVETLAELSTSLASVDDLSLLERKELRLIVLRCEHLVREAETKARARAEAPAPVEAEAIDVFASK